MTAGSLAGRRVLVLHPDFFGIDVALCSALRSVGAEVIAWSTRPSHSSICKALLRVAPLVAEHTNSRVLLSRISEITPGSFDTVVVIKGEGVSCSVLGCLRRKLPGAAFNVYLFDSVRNFPRILRKLRFFDRILSFDPEDCSKHRDWMYRPLYAGDCFWRVCASGAPSVYSLGSFHPERARVLSRFIGMARKSGINCTHDILFRGWIDRARSAIARVDPAIRIMHQAISAEEAARRFSAHSAILDIHHPGQSGLTLRTMEALASGRKLITTNPVIRDHDFFDPSRIVVIDRAAPIVDPGFLSPMPTPVRLPERYGVRSWAIELVAR